jgi:hypothetical protein
MSSSLLRPSGLMKLAPSKLFWLFCRVALSLSLSKMLGDLVSRMLVKMLEETSWNWKFAVSGRPDSNSNASFLLF